MFRSRGKKSFRKRDEDQPEEEIQLFSNVQKKRAMIAVPKIPTPTLKYNSDTMEQLKSEQNLKFNIPSEEQIKFAKELREEKRNVLATEIEPSFVSLDVEMVDKLESRLVREEHDSSEENFEDYNSKALAFGAQAVVDAKAKAIKEKEDLFNQNSSDEEVEEDEQFHRWELEKLRTGQRLALAIPVQQDLPRLEPKVFASNCF